MRIFAAVLGAAAGWGLVRLLGRRPLRREAAPEQGERYPEEEMVEALSRAEGDPAAVAAEFDSLYRGAGEPPEPGKVKRKAKTAAAPVSDSARKAGVRKTKAAAGKPAPARPGKAKTPVRPAGQK